MARFEDLEVWKRSARLSAEIYKILSGLKDFGFRDQITRSGLSIPSNIAEGHERETNEETANFLNYAKGSAGELRHKSTSAWMSATSTVKSGKFGLTKRKKSPRCSTA